MISEKRRIFSTIFIFILLNITLTGFIMTEVSIRAPSNLRVQTLTDIGQVDSLDLTVISDNNPNGELSDQWGLSILIETENSVALLDTGQSYETLRENSLALNKNLNMVDFVVISHEHLDHRGAWFYVKEINPDVPVYVPSLMDGTTFNILNNSGLDIIEINETTIIQPGFAIIGETNGPPYEQALVVNVKDVGLVSFMGCSHPGVENIIEKATNDLGINTYMVIGGFHMHSSMEQDIHDTIERLLELGVKKICPIHCSGDPFRQYMADNYPLENVVGNVGFQMTINIFTINQLLYFILIPVVSVGVAVPLGWFIRRKIKRSKANKI